MLGKKLSKTLTLVRDFTDNPVGMYEGYNPKYARAQIRKLEQRGLVYIQYPHNIAHDPRAVITEKGRAALTEQSHDHRT